MPLESAEPGRHRLPLTLYWVVVAIAVMLADFITGPHVQFPILYVLPVYLAACYDGRWLAMVFAVGLPFVRFAASANASGRRTTDGPALKRMSAPTPKPSSAMAFARIAARFATATTWKESNPDTPARTLRILATPVGATQMGFRLKTPEPQWLGPVLSIAVVLHACTGIPAGIETVGDFDLNRYLGTWYEIARLDHAFERGLSRVSAHYTIGEDGALVVVNRGYDDDGRRWKEARGRAVFVGDPTVGRLKVSFFGPFYGAYNVVALDRERYAWAMVCGPSCDYLWILARSPDLAPERLAQLTRQAATLGFDTARLIRVEHAPMPPPAG